MRLTLKEYGYLMHAVELAIDREKDEEEKCQGRVLLGKIYTEFEQSERVALIS